MLGYTSTEESLLELSLAPPVINRRLSWRKEEVSVPGYIHYVEKYQEDKESVKDDINNVGNSDYYSEDINNSKLENCTQQPPCLCTFYAALAKS